MAKERDASTELLQRLHGYMREHNVDFIGGDFNMSAFSTVGEVFFGTQNFQHLAVRLVSPSCQSVHTSGVWMHMAATSLTMLRFA